jgi:hypothetical protein
MGNEKRSFFMALQPGALDMLLALAQEFQKHEKKGRKL